MTGRPVVSELLRLERENRLVARVCGAVALALLAWQLIGCGASALETHVHSASAAKAVLDVSADVIEAGARTACDEPCEPWLTALHSHNAAVDVWRTWVAIIPIAEGDGDWREAAAAALRLVSLYDDIRQALEGHDVDLPELPSILTQLAEAY